MRLNDLMENTLTDLLGDCNIVKVNPISNAEGVVEKIIVEYVPPKNESTTEVKPINLFGNHSNKSYDK